MTKALAATAAVVLSLAALPAAAECAGKKHDVTASTSTTEIPVIRAPETST